MVRSLRWRNLRALSGNGNWQIFHFFYVSLILGTWGPKNEGGRNRVLEGALYKLWWAHFWWFFSTNAWNKRMWTLCLFLKISVLIVIEGDFHNRMQAAEFLSQSVVWDKPPQTFTLVDCTNYEEVRINLRPIIDHLQCESKGMFHIEFLPWVKFSSLTVWHHPFWNRTS